METAAIPNGGLYPTRTHRELQRAKSGSNERVKNKPCEKCGKNPVAFQNL